MSDQPKVTLQQWKERVIAGRNIGGNITQPGTDGVHSSSSGDGASNGSASAKGSGNPLHPDVSEEVARLRETVSIIKRQIYGASTGEGGIVKHLTEVEDSMDRINSRLTTLEGQFGALVTKFVELLVLLGVDEEGEDAKPQ